jgi:hypothetical protein
MQGRLGRRRNRRLHAARYFQLITKRHIQKAPSFPHPMDLAIDAHSGQVTVRSSGKGSKDTFKSEHRDLSPDLNNGPQSIRLPGIQA